MNSRVIMMVLSISSGLLIGILVSDNLSSMTSAGTNYMAEGRHISTIPDITGVESTIRINSGYGGGLNARVGMETEDNFEIPAVNFVHTGRTSVGDQNGYLWRHFIYFRNNSGISGKMYGAAGGQQSYRLIYREDFCANPSGVAGIPGPCVELSIDNNAVDVIEDWLLLKFQRVFAGGQINGQLPSVGAYYFSGVAIYNLYLINGSWNDSWNIFVDNEALVLVNIVHNTWGWQQVTPVY